MLDVGAPTALYAVAGNTAIVASKNREAQMAAARARLDESFGQMLVEHAPRARTADGPSVLRIAV